MAGLFPYAVSAKCAKKGMILSSKSKRRHPLLVLTPGDPDGIGPEITWKAIQTYS